MWLLEKYEELPIQCTNTEMTHIGARIELRIKKENFVQFKYEWKQGDKLYFVQAVKDDLVLSPFPPKKGINKYYNIERPCCKLSGLKERLLQIDKDIPGWVIDINEFSNKDGLFKRETIDPRYVESRVSGFKSSKTLPKEQYNKYSRYSKPDGWDEDLTFGDEPSTFVSKGEKIEGKQEFFVGVFLDRGGELKDMNRYYNWGIRVTACHQPNNDGFYSHTVEKLKSKQFDCRPKEFNEAVENWNDYIDKLISKGKLELQQGDVEKYIKFG